MASFSLPALALVVGMCVVMAVLGGMLTGNGLQTWYPGLRKPWFQIPLWAFIGVGIIGYLMDATILYRLMTKVPSRDGKVVTIAAMLILMLYNELWNGAFFRLRSTLVGLVGLLGFLAPLAMAQIALAVYDRLSAGILLIYVLWYLLYDVPWAYALWRLNPPSQ
jgi:tryptophan-rich sensory protein